jgi:hypothetical protein
MRSLFFLSAFYFSRIFSPGDVPSEFIDPTGTYVLMGTIKKNRITGHSGEIRVQLLDSQRIALCFYLTKGYPGYESGSFIDTLPYEANATRYTCKKDTTCTILFYFYPNKVEIMPTYSNPYSGGGYPNGVLISAVFSKSSSDRPVIQDLSARGISQ